MKDATRLPPRLCPRCGYTLDAASNLHDPKQRPKPDDYCLCIACAGYLQFDAQLRLVIPDPIVLAEECRKDPDLDRSLRQQREAIEAVQRTNPIIQTGRRH